MESIERNVGDLSPSERELCENVLGHKLHTEQRVIIHVTDVDTHNSRENEAPTTADPTPPSVDDWAILRDLSDEEVAELEAAILDRSGGREINI